MKVDIIIIAATKSDNLKKMTQNAIDSLHKSEDKHSFNVLLIETHDQTVKYKGCNTIPYIQANNFNYNRTINYALQYCTNHIIGFFNNDVIFKSKWFTELIKGFKDFDSLSPMCKISHKGMRYDVDFKGGYEIRKEICGWAIVTKREVLQKIGLLNESVKFWRSEYVYIHQLKSNNFKHALCTKSFVNHLDNGSNTLNTVSLNYKKDITTKQHHKPKLDIKYRKFTVVMASFLGEYKNAAKNRDKKFLRAVKSVIKQSFKNWELIIVSDGCDKTVSLYNKFFSHIDNIKCIKIPKQKYLSGNVRQTGIDNAFSKYIIYLDSDDLYGEDHLNFVDDGLKDNAWVYFDDILNYATPRYKNVKLQMGLAGTSSICHKRLMNASWTNCDGYTHDFKFIQQLIDCRKKYNKIGKSFYYICHTVNSGLDV